MVYGILMLINFAHGEVYMLGAFFGLFIAQRLGLTHSPSVGTFILVLTLSMVGCGLVGATIERLAYRPLRHMPRLNLLITAIGLSLFLQNGGQLLFGADPKFFPELIQRQVLFSIGNISISNYQLIVIGVSIFLMLALQHIIFRTRT